MFAFIKGKLYDIDEDTMIIENNNIGYDIKVPLSVIHQLPMIGEEVIIHTYLYVREDIMALYGFLTKDDLNIFKKLITVSGIGPRGALGILSTISPDELRFAVIGEDVKTISKAPGIGKKTAQKLILELKDKLNLEDTLKNPNTAQSETIFEAKDIKSEAVQALVALGYTHTEALKAIRTIVITDDTTVEDIIKEGLKKLSML
ncbi:Holliday junction DNA helicase subunit RuvA [Natranaerovirga hydrolytica]|uniref:Holliday junction branch migration complex subunit RuvA n=1 Tax=Natranaerovirga hydrolytica TaxID=680378 RepID=A0A4R1MYK3_9FIRM|nr:Holliday junction branch migration protein RuvA [Natranaerovirga hydrolytica]TCK98215.1 Holliday junction DNA helicase subunit RuvA [Natranaerovirga hydrolytica]